jgi:Cu(I)/Ag(I) efflux system membrane fusion protein
MKNILNNRILQLGLVLVAGLFLGWLIFKSDTTKVHDHSQQQGVETTYTCSMHPQIRQNEPGKCPICGMELIPVAQKSDKGENSPFVHTMSPEAIALANVQTQKVKSVSPEHELYLTGKIAVNEQKLAVITANYSGRIEKLFIDFTGQTVNKGQKLASIYSPELVTSQKELIEAAKFKDINSALYNASKEKLRLWKINETQIADIENSGVVLTEFNVYADQSGVVMRRNISKGDYVNKGNVLFEIADLSNVWIFLDAYESDLPFMKVGQKISFTVASIPGKEFASSISFIDPLINPQTRTAAVRAELNNPQQILKPEMFVKGKIKANLSVGKKSIVIPKTSILWTGKRSVVYVKVPNTEFPSFVMREITLGASLGEYYIIESGLTEGEEIVSNGVFAIDASAQLAGKPSMMSPEGGPVTTAHNHGGMNVGGNASKEVVVAKTKAVGPKPLSIGKKAKKALQPLYTDYLQWKDALANDNFKEAKKTATNIKTALDKININLFKGAAHDAWMDYQGSLSRSLEHVEHFSDIDQLRKAFQSVSTTMIKLTITFTPLDKTIYVQHCPMADNNKGADWLSTEKQIKNPYFGSSMLSCGEITKEIK